MTSTLEPRTIETRVLRHPKVRTGLAMLVFLGLLAASHPFLQATLWSGKDAMYHPETGYDTTLSHPTGVSGAHWLGTDSLGRDVMSSLTYALTPALQVALLAAVLVGVLSLAVGSAAAYFRGWIDSLLTNLGDAFALLPPTIVLLIIGLGSGDLGMIDAGLIFGVLYGLGPATLVVRSRALAVVEKPFIEAARIAGAGPRRIMGVHLLPHLLPYVGVQMMSAAIWALASVSFVQYLGATDQSRVGLGSMIYSGLDFQPVLPGGFGEFNLGEFHARIGWTSMLSAALAMTLIASAFYLVAVGSRDAIVPAPLMVARGRRRPNRFRAR
ncbi:MAG TPA: ABC transporter permease [Acidimicrobiia bacterium]|nr:ABC transporter permease [Acidimicrobiia bacterium]